MATEDFCLKWNDHHSIFFSLAETLCREGLLTDVTLATSTRTFSAHRLVLSVCSSFFKNLLARPEFSKPNSGLNAFVFLKDVEASHLEMLLSYMYRGEINVEEGDLMDLLRTARGLGIKGLSDVDDLGTTNDVKVKEEPQRKRKRSEEITVLDDNTRAQPSVSTSKTVFNQNATDKYQSIAPDTDENIQVVEPTLNQSIETEEDGGWYGNEDEIDGGEYDENYDGIYDEAGGIKAGFGELSLNCPECPKQFASSWHLKRHVQTHSKQKKFQCSICAKFFSRNDNLKSHQKSVHGIAFPTLPSKSPSLSKSMSLIQH